MTKIHRKKKRPYNVTVLSGSSYEVTVEARSAAGAKAAARAAVLRSLNGEGDDLVVDGDVLTVALDARRAR